MKKDFSYPKNIRQEASGEEYPWFTNPEIMNKLESLVEGAINSKTSYGYISAVLLESQLIEEMCRVQIQSMRRFIEESCGTEMKFSPQNKDLEDKPLGQLISLLNLIPEMHGELIEKLNNFNSIRKQCVHKLTSKNYSKKFLRSNAINARKLATEIFKKFENAYDGFRQVWAHNHEHWKEIQEECEDDD